MQTHFANGCYGRTNGTVFTVVAVRDRAIALLPEGAPPDSEWWWCPMIELSTENTEDFHFVRRQFPFKHAWAATINKGQGATLDCFAIWCDTMLFGHGQAYTALSRGRSQKTCKVYVSANNSHPDVLHSVVEPSLLSACDQPHPAATSATGEQGGHEHFGSLITAEDVMARYRGLHFPHGDGTHGRVVKARKCGGGSGWEVMIVWYNPDGSAEPMSEGEDHVTSSGTLRWHKEGQGMCVRSKFIPDV